MNMCILAVRLKELFNLHLFMARLRRACRISSFLGSLLAVSGNEVFSQGEFALFNRNVGIGLEAPVSIKDPATGLCIRPNGPPWHVGVCVGLEGTPIDQLQPLAPLVEFGSAAGAGYVIPQLFVVPNSTVPQRESVLLRVFMGTEVTVSPVVGVAGPFTVTLALLSAPNIVPLANDSLDFCVPEPGVNGLLTCGATVWGTILVGSWLRRGSRR